MLIWIILESQANGFLRIFVSFHPFAFTGNPVQKWLKEVVLSRVSLLTNWFNTWSSGQVKTPLKAGVVYFRKMYDRSTMKLLMRKYKDEADNEKIRVFLQEVFLQNNQREICWTLNRWDYWRWHINENIFKFNLTAAVFIWESEDGKIAAVLHPEGSGDAFLQIHPDYDSRELEIEMVSVAETHFAITQPNGDQQLVIWAHESALIRQDLLTRRGYSRRTGVEYQRHRDMQVLIPDVKVPDGFSIRALGLEDELPARSWVSWKAFHADEPGEKYYGWQWYHNVQRAPLYRRELDLVAVAPDGELAAFCTLWYDDKTKTASVDPVGTHPDFQRKGLAKALLAEGLRRVKELGATLCLVSSFSVEAGELYSSMGFSRYELCEPWIKNW